MVEQLCSLDIVDNEHQVKVGGLKVLVAQVYDDDEMIFDDDEVILNNDEMKKFVDVEKERWFVLVHNNDDDEAASVSKRPRKRKQERKRKRKHLKYKKMTPPWVGGTPHVSLPPG